MSKKVTIVLVGVLFLRIVGSVQAKTMTYYMWFLPPFAGSDEKWTLTMERWDEARGSAQYWLTLKYKYTEQTMFQHPAIQTLGPYTLYAGQRQEHDLLGHWQYWYDDCWGFDCYMIEIKVTDSNENTWAWIDVIDYDGYDLFSLDPVGMRKLPK